MSRAALVGPLVVAVLLLAPASVASAHPLGNLTINHYAGLVLRPEAVLVDYVIDYAEIPTVQLRADVQRDDARACEALGGGLGLHVDGRELTLDLVGHHLSFPAGQAGLDLMRLECRFSAALAVRGEAHTLAFADTNYAERIGWREMTARGYGTAIETDLPRDSVSDRLTAYPQDPFTSPPDVRLTRLRFTATATPVTAAAEAEATTVEVVARPADALAALLTRTDLGQFGLLFAFVLAAGLGGIHALSPGHGKTVMAAYLVGSRGSFRQAGLLGVAVAVSHTAGVLGLGVLTLAGGTLIAPDRVYPYLSVLSAAIMLAVGFWLVGGRVRRRIAHGHGHSHAHASNVSGPVGWRALAALGLAGGLLPSASALLVLIGAISLHRVELGLLLVVAFGLGMAATLVGVGTALVGAGRIGSSRLAPHAALVRLCAYVPSAAAVLVLLLGLGMTAQSVMAFARP